MAGVAVASGPRRLPCNPVEVLDRESRIVAEIQEVFTECSKSNRIRNLKNKTNASKCTDNSRFNEPRATTKEDVSTSRTKQSPRLDSLLTDISSDLGSITSQSDQNCWTRIKQWFLCHSRGRQRFKKYLKAEEVFHAKLEQETKEHGRRFKQMENMLEDEVQSLRKQLETKKDEHQKQYSMMKNTLSEEILNLRKWVEQCEKNNEVVAYKEKYFEAEMQSMKNENAALRKKIEMNREIHKLRKIENEEKLEMVKRALNDENKILKRQYEILNKKFLKEKQKHLKWKKAIVNLRGARRITLKLAKSGYLSSEIIDHQICQRTHCSVQVERVSNRKARELSDKTVELKLTKTKHAEEISKLRTMVSKVNSENETLEREVLSQDDQIKKLNKQILDCEKVKEEMNNTVNNLNYAFERLKQNIKEKELLKLEMGKLKRELTVKNVTIRDLEAELVKSGEDLKRAVKTLKEKATENVSKLREKVEHKNRSNDKLKEILAQKEAMIASLQQQTTEKSNEVLSVKLELSEMDKKVLITEKEVENLKQIVEEKEREIEDFEKEFVGAMDNKKREIKLLQEENAGQGKKLKEAKDKLLSVSQHLREAEQELIVRSNMQEDAEQLRIINNEKNHELRKYILQKDEEIGKLNDKVEKLRKEYDSLKAENDALLRKHESQKNALIELQQELYEREGQRTNVEADNPPSKVQKKRNPFFDKPDEKVQTFKNGDREHEKQNTNNYEEKDDFLQDAKGFGQKPQPTESRNSKRSNSRNANDMEWFRSFSDVETYRNANSSNRRCEIPTDNSSEAHPTNSERSSRGTNDLDGFQSFADVEKGRNIDRNDKNSKLNSDSRSGVQTNVRRRSGSGGTGIEMFISFNDDEMSLGTIDNKTCGDMSTVHCNDDELSTARRPRRRNRNLSDKEAGEQLKMMAGW